MACPRQSRPQRVLSARRGFSPACSSFEFALRENLGCLRQVLWIHQFSPSLQSSTPDLAVRERLPAPWRSLSPPLPWPPPSPSDSGNMRSEEHTSVLQSR